MSISPFLLLNLYAQEGQNFNTNRVADSAIKAEIVVTAERFPVEGLNSSRNVTKVNSSVLNDSLEPNIVGALRQNSGIISYKAFGPEGISHGGMNSQLSIRGMRNGELVTINGMSIQEASGGAYNIDLFSPAQINNVEILKGGGSILYGADAESGVINLITTKKSSATPFRFKINAGTEESFYSSAGYSTDFLDLDFYYRQLGARDEISRSYSQKYTYSTSPLDKIGFGILFQPIEDLTFDIIGGGYGITFKKKDYKGNIIESTDQETYWNFTDVRLEKENFNLKGFFSWNKMDADRFLSSQPDYRNTTIATGSKGDVRYSTEYFQQVIGADYVYRAADYNQQYGFHYRNELAPLTEIKITPFEILTLSLGAREQFMFADSDATDYDRFLPAFGANLKVIEGLHLFADSSKAFRAPTFNQLYYDSYFLVGNPALGPEMGWTHQSGVKLSYPVIEGTISIFYMDYEDKIVTDPTSYPSKYINADSFNSIGLDWDLSFKPGILPESFDKFRLNASGYVADPESETAAGKKSQSGDKVQMAFGISYVGTDWKGNITFAGVEKRENDISPYQSVDTSIAKRIYKGWLKAEIRNVLDETIVISGNMTPNASSRYEYYGLPRMFSVGYEISF